MWGDQAKSQGSTSVRNVSKVNTSFHVNILHLLFARLSGKRIATIIVLLQKASIVFNKLLWS
jgi:hypothetical protein